MPKRPREADSPVSRKRQRVEESNNVESPSKRQQDGEPNSPITPRRSKTAQLHISPASPYQSPHKHVSLTTGLAELSPERLTPRVLDLSAATAGQLSLEDKVKQLLADTQQALQTEDVTAAMETLNALLVLDSTNVFALITRGQLHGLSGHYFDAASDFAAALRADPTQSILYLYRAEIYYNQQLYSQAWNDLNRPQLAAMNLPATALYKGLVMLAQGGLANAITHLTDAYDRGEGEQKNTALKQRAHAYLLLSDYHNVIEDAELLLRTDNYQVEGYFFRGLAFFNNESYYTAEADFRRALEINPKHAAAICLRAYSIFLQDKESFADSELECFQEALEISPDYVEAYEYRGDVYFYKENYASALKDYLQALKLNPTNVNYVRIIGECYYYLGDFENAIEYLGKFVLNANVVSDKVYEMRGQAYLAHEQPYKAIADFTAAIEQDGTKGIYYYRRAEVFVRLAKFEDAAKDYNEAIELEPCVDHKYYAGLAKSKYQLKNFDEAIFNYEVAYGLDEKNIDYLEQLVHLNRQTGDVRSACRYSLLHYEIAKTKIVLPLQDLVRVKFMCGSNGEPGNSDVNECLVEQLSDESESEVKVMSDTSASEAKEMPSLNFDDGRDHSQSLRALFGFSIK